MAFCVRCGVELDKGIKSCPLCDTEVLVPDEQGEGVESTHFSSRIPRRTRIRSSMMPSKGFIFLATFIILIPILVTFMIDFSANRTITWSFYPITALALIWILISYPSFFKGYTIFQVLTVDVLAISVFLLSLDMYSGPFPQWAHYAALSLLLIWVYAAGLKIFKSTKTIPAVLVWILGTGLFLWAMDVFTKKRSWFLPLALPLLGVVAATGILVFLIIQKLREKSIKRLFASGMSALILTLFIIGVNIIVDLYVFGGLKFSWSLILAAALIPLVLFFLILNKAPELKTYLAKKFHL